jgi:hypothetical protein
MVKRRNSPFASFDRMAPRRVPMDGAPVMLKPGRITKARNTKVQRPPPAGLWSVDNPGGGFIP